IVTTGEDYTALYVFYYNSDFVGTATVNGGSVNSIWNCGTLTVSGGTVDYLDNSSTLTVSGGTVTEILAKDGSDAAGEYTITIADASAISIPAGYVLKEIEEGKYQVLAGEIDGTMLGAQLRVDGTRGLRFGTQINFNDFMTDLGTASSVTDVTYGTLVTPASFLGDAELTHEILETVRVADVVAENVLEYVEGEYAIFTAVVTGIPDDATQFTARGYVKYSEDGGETFIYHYFDPVTRSIDEVKDNAGWTE
ncbi:MAG: hypothetical protein IJO52_02445, partial [Clostridia bacterium]|nr:hypothetical protein [Clostridia bacterium]